MLILAGWSLPVRGAWIEICLRSALYHIGAPSLPVRGAWIEIPRLCRPRHGGRCRSPCGERGLKWRYRDD